MTKLLVVVALSVLVVAALGAREDAWYGVQEAACLRQGGLCLARGECAAPLGRPGELCVQQAAQGFQCCLGLPIHERRCHKRGGQCFQKGFCNQRFVYSEARDCEGDQECCILL